MATAAVTEKAMSIEIGDLEPAYLARLSSRSPIRTVSVGSTVTCGEEGEGGARWSWIAYP